MSFQLKPNVVSSKVMTDGEAAYLAGIIDGEGTISLVSQGARKLGPKLRVANTDLALLERVIAFSGNGQIVQKNLAARAHRVCYEWTVSANQIRHLLPQVLPHLFSKRPQAELLLRYLQIVRYPQGVAPEDRDEVEAIRDELARLNQRIGDPERRAEIEARYGKKPCQQDGCEQRRYRNEPWCYQHWQEYQEAHVTHCAHCGAETQALHVHKRFCSQKCQTAHWHEAVQRPRLDARALARESPPCPACGKEVDRTHYAGKTFCDAHCQAVHRARQKKRPPDYQIEKQCARCGTTFHTKFGKQKYCGDACNKAAYRERAHPE